MNEQAQPYSIITIDPATIEDEEQLGSKPKFWFRHEGRRWLFKEARENTGEHWAEKAAAEIAHLLDIPAARVELAESGGRMGCACRSFIEDRQKDFLIHGNEVLAGMEAGYDKAKRFRQSDHTLAKIVGAIESVFPAGRPREVAAARLAGYVVFDGLIANTDRHHENWGLLLHAPSLEKFAVEVAPSFDHASSLGRELTDDARRSMLQEDTVLRYLRRGRGGIYKDASDAHGCSPLELSVVLAEKYPPFFEPWQARIEGLNETALRGIFTRIPDVVMSPAARDFSLALVLRTRQHLLAAPC